MNVLKRDGRIQELNENKIWRSINNARCAVYNDDLFLVETVTGEVCAQCFEGITTKEIHSLVCKELNLYGVEKVAEAFGLFSEARAIYRKEHI